MDRRMFLTGSVLGAAAGAVAGWFSPASATKPRLAAASKPTNNGTEVELNALLAATPPGGLCKLDGGTWTINHPVNVPEQVTLDGSGATFVQPTDGRDLTYPYAKNWDTGLRGRCAVTLAAGATVRNVNVVGPGSVFDPATEAQHAFAARGAGVLIEHCSVTNVLGDGISFGEQSGCVARHVTVNGTGRQGFSWVHGTDGLLEDSSFTNIARTVMDLEPMATLAQVIRGFTVRRVTADVFGNFLLGSGSSGECHDVIAEDITASRLAVKFQRRDGGPKSNLTFRRLTGTGLKSGEAFTFHNIDGPVVIDGCSQPFADTKETVYAVRAVNTPGVVLSGCSFPGADGDLTTV